MKKIFAANWKLFKSPRETRDFFAQWSEAFTGSAASSRKPSASAAAETQSSSAAEVVFFPSAVSLEAAITAGAKASIASGHALSFGVQNVYAQQQGAFTGENSVSMVKELGCKYVLIGHSERRALFQESDSLLAEKVAVTQGVGLVPMFCIGETLAQREAGHTAEILRGQLTLGLEKASADKPLVIAYEPVWAIGTGKVATTEQVRETHQQVHEMLKTLGFTAPILYGGSVKPDNAAALIALPHVDGFLVGGASLEVSSFKKICEAEAH